MIKKIATTLSKKKTEIDFLFPPEKEKSNVFDFGGQHTIKIELKKEFSKRHIEFNMENLIKLTSSLLSISYSDDGIITKEEKTKLLFLESNIIPIITINEKQSFFLNPEDIKWYSIYWGSSGKGKSYFSSLMFSQQLKANLLYYINNLLNFMAEYDTNDDDLIHMNFQHEWDRLLDRVQDLLLKS